MAEGLEAIARSAPAFAVIDMRLGDGNGLDVISDLKARRPDARGIILTGYGNIATAVTAVKLGAFDYLAKPADADEIFSALMATQHDKAELPENPMSADRVRWSTSSGSTNSAGATCRRRRAVSTCTAEPAAYPRQTRPALRPRRLNGRGLTVPDMPSNAPDCNSQ